MPVSSSITPVEALLTLPLLIPLHLEGLLSKLRQRIPATLLPTSQQFILSSISRKLPLLLFQTVSTFHSCPLFDSPSFLWLIFFKSPIPVLSLSLLVTNGF